MKKRDGDIEWTVNKEERQGVTVYVLRFEKQKSGLLKGQYHPYFWLLPQVFIAQFVEAEYTHWEAFCGDELIDSNIVIVGNRVATPEEVAGILG